MNAELLRSRLKGLQIVAIKLVEGILGGGYRSVFKGQGMEFDEVREYVETDDARLIDWNVSSRFGGVFTKTFREEREITLFLVVDASASVFAGGGNRRHTAALLLSLLSFAAIQNSDRVGAVFFSDRIEKWIPPRKGTRHALRLIGDSLSFRPRGRGSDLSLALRASCEAVKRRGIVFVLSDFKTGGYQKELLLLARKHDVIAVRVFSPVDEEFPETGLAYLEDPETREVLVGAGMSAKFRGDYGEFRQMARRAWLRDCDRLGVSAVEISTRDDPGEKLLQFFRRRRARQ
ncbi:MAG: DUF58 domain-containing protein [Spirochaetaceae bacterium]|nr:DUF58 domain-containing protein [Spirochaetaceae bacterium]